MTAMRGGDAGADPRAEARARLGGEVDVRVLEPSPPAVAEPPWMADDPVDGGDVVPVERPGARSWASVCAERDDHTLLAWCTERWLVRGALAPLPSRFGAARAALHAVAEHVVAPARWSATGKIGLRYTFRGFGTPYFGADRQVRVQAGRLVVDGGERELTTLRAAALAAGIEPGAPAGVYQPVTAPDFDAALAIDGDAADALGSWFGFAASVLEQVRADATRADAPSRVQIWPEHFDMAVDLGVDGRRANYGASPGDEQHPEPYLYVGPWEPVSGSFWNEPWGASLPYQSLLEGADPLEFFRQGKEML